MSSSYRPLPPRPPRPTSGFPSADYWRPEDERRSHEFSFRNSSAAPQYPREHDHYEPSRKPSRQPSRSRQNDEYARNQRGSDNDRRNENGGNSRARPSQRPHTRFQRGRGNRHFATAARPLLSLKQADAVEQTLGVADDPNVARRFLHVDDITDSEEEQMDESDSDQEKPDNPVSRSSEMGPAQPGLEPPAKRRALGIASSEATVESQVPRWSNPDPYTSLPPVDELRKRKDVVKIIRKARIAVDKGATVADQAGIDEDFISFGFEETLAPKGSSARSTSFTAEDHGIRELTVTSSEPRRFSHLQNLHGEHLAKAPGTVSMALSTDVQGSPPGLVSKLLPDTNIATFDAALLDQDDPLGSRKRTHDDVIKSPSKKPVWNLSDNYVLDAWVPWGDCSLTPWLDKSARRSGSVGFRLHKEICDFYDYVRPQPFEQELREDLLDRLQAMIAKQFYNCRVYCFGSFAAGIYLPKADMDVVVISESFRLSGVKVACQNAGHMHRFGNYLRRSGLAKEDSVVVITGAKVPLIKFVDQTTGINVDMSFENQTGLTANETFKAWKRQFPAMPIIVTLIKQFLLMRACNEVVTGGLGGFSVTCLVTSLMQNLPRIQSGELIPEHHLGEILIEFLDLYGNRFDLTRTGISMNPPGYFDKHFQNERNRGGTYQANKLDRLAIMDPNNADNDISGGSKKVMLIFHRFSQAHSEIMSAMRSPNRRSLLDWMLGGDYRTYKDQRSHLQTLYRSMRGIPERAAIDYRMRVPVRLYREETTIEKLTRLERYADVGLVPNQRSLHYFENPLSEEAEIAAQRLHRKKNEPKSKKPKAKKPKIKKPKAKKPTAKKSKEKARLPQSISISDSDEKHARVPPNFAITGSYARPTTQEIELNGEFPNLPDKALSTFVNAANQLIEMATSSVRHNPEGTDYVKGRAHEKVEKRRPSRWDK